MKSIFFSALFLFTSHLLQAQINESDTLLLQHFSAVTGSVQTGNFKAFALRTKFDASWAPSARFAFKTQNSYRYQSFFERKVDNEFSNRNFFYVYQHRRLYPFAMAFFSSNFRRKIDLRYFTGAGMTWQLVRQQKHSLKLSLSGVYESTQFSGTQYNDASYNGKDKINTWRATFRLFGKHALANNKWRAYYEAYYQPALQESNNYRWHTELGLDYPIWKGLSINALFMYDHENITIYGVKQNDLITTFGVSYSHKIQ